ncbi:MAG: antibiotic biosynthesis monooxygenase [Planctomycetota bacterium]|nr:MAG: antibiotic biosynthesis monooxygenase [Planctomycetota bacterium]REK26911.1 MAG: antibiotic biosynthesis monooxygenase [Planctomycetota bacterium]REK35400.1 MAG: antibiotic biosynthesis monooxygenase [Planctomycetota bacterium]
MHCLNVILTVKQPDDVDEVAALLTEAGRMSREEPGCLRFEVCHSQADPQIFILCERWESVAAWEAHKEERAFKEIYQPRVLPLVDRVPHPSSLLE